MHKPITQALTGDNSDRHPSNDSNAEKRANDSLFKDRLAAEADSKLLDIFLDNSSSSNMHGYTAKLFHDHCPNDILEKLFHGRPCGPSDAPAAWLDDRSGDTKPRSYNGTMAIADFHSALRLKRFGSMGEPEAAIRRMCATSDLYVQSTLLTGSRHIQTPNAPAVASLILTSTPLLAPVLQSFLQRHFRAEKTIKISLASEKPTFAMEFHTSYPMWGPVGKQGAGHRDSSHLKRLLHTRYLSREEDPETYDRKTEGLYEAHASCVVAGYSMSIWDAVSLVNRSLGPESDEDPNSLLSYNKSQTSWADDTTGVDITDVKMDEFTAPYRGVGEKGRADFDDDPLTYGRKLAKTPYHDPRVYFLTVLKVRSEYMLYGWYNTTDDLEAEIETYLETSPLWETEGLGNAPHQTESIEDSEEWVTKKSRLLGDLIHLLEESIDAWTSFESRDGDCFKESRPELQDNQLGRLFREVSDVYEDLRKVQMRLNALQTLCKNFQHQISRAVMVRENRVFALQHWTVTVVNITIPPTLASSVMQSNSINFHPPTLCFIVLSGFFGAIIFALRPGSPLYSRSRNAAAVVRREVARAGVPVVGQQAAEAG